MVGREELLRHIGTVVGLAGIGLVVAGVWGLYGWQWGAIVAGLPVAGFYLYGEWCAVRGGVYDNRGEG